LCLLQYLVFLKIRQGILIMIPILNPDHLNDLPQMLSSLFRARSVIITFSPATIELKQSGSR
jgi:hypothetical protein